MIRVECDGLINAINNESVEYIANSMRIKYGNNNGNEIIKNITGRDCFNNLTLLDLSNNTFDNDGDRMRNLTYLSDKVMGLESINDSEYLKNLSGTVTRTEVIVSSSATFPAS